MGFFDYDSYPDHDWDDSWETVWNEYDWEAYLKREEDEIPRYQKLYAKHIKSSNRLDEVAAAMGWESAADALEGAEAEEEIAEPDDDQPYTLHKHPLYIASKALHSWLSEKWVQHVALSSDRIAAADTTRLPLAIQQSDQYGLLAVTALDIGDYSLAVAYFKRGLAALNVIHSHLNRIEDLGIETLDLYVKQARLRLFDLREIWLRVTGDCREAMTRGSEED